MYGSSKRFIAGAVCPQCRSEDRVLVYRRDGQDCRECVACGWREVWADPHAPRSATTTEPTESVRMIEPPNDAGTG